MENQWDMNEMLDSIPSGDETWHREIHHRWKDLVGNHLQQTGDDKGSLANEDWDFRNNTEGLQQQNSG